MVRWMSILLYLSAQCEGELAGVWGFDVQARGI